MYNDVKIQIVHGRFKLTEMQHRIKKLYALGELTESQFDELFSLLADNANPEMERPEGLALIQALAGKVDALTSCVEALTARVKALEGGDADCGTDEGDTDEYPAWEPWDGLSDKYQPGVIVSHSGQLWESVYSGQNVWEPGVVDQRFWIQYTPEV